MSTLIVVESPTKAKTITRFLGAGYTVVASMGHVRDLPKSELGYDEQTYEPTYVNSTGRTDAVKILKKAAAGAGEVIIATDPDREGEAIGWHVAQVLGLRGQVKRLEFHEITKSAIQDALAHPRTLNMDLINAQQARRVLDRVVGYKLSPLLWRKVQRGLSAGRVQSVAVRIICEREREIEAFTPQEYWTVDATFTPTTAAPDARSFMARLHQVAGKKPQITSREEADRIKALLESQAFGVKDLRTNRVKRSAPPPFTTSTLQQAASQALGWPAARTMQVAQQLYEGISVGGEGQVGLITYMRTDSVNIAETALSAAREMIAAQFGPEFVPPTPMRYKSKAKGAQEAHEAVRPTEPARIPEAIASSLSSEQLALYRLIWRRFVACQMKPAESDRTTVDVEGTAAGAQASLLRATSSTLVFAGFLAVYGATPDDAESESEKDRDRARAEHEEREGAGAENRGLPPLRKGEGLRLLGVKPDQHFTEPPPRYNEGSLIKFLEAEGIGRPSTYASIISTIQDRGYVVKEGKAFRPTPIGHTVNDLLTAHFSSIVDTGFTAGLEEQLDDIAEGKMEWRHMLAGFADPFLRQLAEKMTTLDRVSVGTGETCPQCGKELIERSGRYGKFVACSGYPECDYVKREPKAQPTVTDETCPDCGKPLVERQGRYGPFLSCTGYPTCKYIKKEAKAEPTPTDETCPDCGKPLVERQGRYGPFLSCTGYPTCKYIKREKAVGAASNGKAPRASRPQPKTTDVKCPKCGSPMLERIASKGPNAGKPFLGCGAYPKCKETLELKEVAAQPAAG